MHVEARESEREADESGCTPVVSLAAKLGRWALRAHHEALRPIGLKPRHLGALVELRSAPLTQQSLCDAVGTDPAQLVGLLNDLEAEALVRRRRDPDDRRRHIVEISELGLARLAAADRALADVDARMMAGLAPEERARLKAMLFFVTEHGGFDQECASKSEPCDEADAEFVKECPESR